MSCIMYCVTQHLEYLPSNYLPQVIRTNTNNIANFQHQKKEKESLKKYTTQNVLISSNNLVAIKAQLKSS